MTSIMADWSGVENEEGADILLDMDYLMDMLNSENSQKNGEDLLSQGSGGGDDGGDFGVQGFQMPADVHERDALDFETWDFGYSSSADDQGEQCSQSHGDCGTEGMGTLQCHTHHCISQSSFDEGNLGIPSNSANYLAFNNQFRQYGGAINSENMGTFNGSSMGSLDTSFKSSVSLPGKTAITSRTLNATLPIANIALSSCDPYPIESAVYGNFDVCGSLGECNASIQSGVAAVSYPQTNFPGDHCSDFNFDGLDDNGYIQCNLENEVKAFHANSASSGSDISVVDQSEVKGLHLKFEGGSDSLLIPGHVPLCYTHPGISKEQHFYAEDNDLLDESQSTMFWHANELGSGANILAGKGSKNLSFGTSASMPSQMHVLDSEEMKVKTHAYLGSRPENQGVACRIPVNHGYSSPMVKEQHLPFNTTKQSVIIKDEGEGKLQSKVFGSSLSSVSPESTQSNSSSSKSHVDDDTDVCIIEDISQPTRQQNSLPLEKASVPPHAAYSDLQYAGFKFRPTDERFVFRVALQDLSQPKSEATPPDGVLAVPLLRHQRIALSWMVQKETSSLYCSGGILADDQGLGKTVSTIALILKERPPALRVDTQLIKKEEFETLDLDDDDEVTEVVRKKQSVDICNVDDKPDIYENCFVKSKGRPAAGTLVVCPTSVLRQWADELHKKVTKEANLRVLVYHGSNRTKDPCDLAKYDVVLTTYAIVSMEVPKQPLVDEDSDEKTKMDGEDGRYRGLSSWKKRKYPPSSGKNGSKSKRGIDCATFESLARPLAKVAWFRVVLDEAQSIKNHRTQVARACWGLRAKRRWCLSGTPIQNAIDDLYSYFRFLRYDPYAVYKTFCSTIKVPIQKSPTKGYRKLQAVLKTIMLRRTKGTLIDGEPIITLPPKVVELKKVDFTEEERNFYTRLEADSRAQFKEYAEAGTVKQNYVNILLMLLRLRQACDHPLLVRGPDSDSLGKKSVEVAKKLSCAQQIHLLNFLEASLAICGICNDPPEDAVVSVCGHVFCNQCISEHLSGDDNQCPSSNCKVRLNLSSVFSKATLTSSLHGQPAGDLDSGQVEQFKPYSVDCPLDSSKIRAALDVLKSLTKPPNLASDGSLENSSSGNASCPIISPCNPLNNTSSERVNCERKSNPSAGVVGEKAIVFSQWTRMLDLLETCLKNSSIQYRRLDGTMSVLARDKAVNDFNTLPGVSVMIMSLKAASLGLNMVAACRVLLLDLWWNPTTEDQAIDRAHRIGQTRPVTVLRLTVRDTVEDRILALQQKKREMVASAFGEDESGSRQSRLTVDDLKYLFMV